VGRGLGALLQLGAPITEALVLGRERLPLPQDRRLGLPESLMSAGQHPREESWCRFWLGAMTEPPKSLGPPKVVLVQRTSDNPAGAPDHLTSSISEFLTFVKSVSPVTQTLQYIGGTKIRKKLQ
jgi:hypothetical protein